jgi:hypothetical protein
MISVLCCFPSVTASLWQKPAATDKELKLTPYEAFYDVIPELDAQQTRCYLKEAEPQAVPAYFSVRTIERNLGEFSHMSPAEIHIKIHNPKPDSYWCSVTIISHGVYSGSAKFKMSLEDQPDKPLIYSLSPVVRGDYEVVVHELA